MRRTDGRACGLAPLGPPATIDSNGGVSGTLTDGTAYTTQIPVALQDTNLSTLLQEHGVQITGESP